MKQILFILAFLAISVPIVAQESSQISLHLRSEGGVPVGDLSNYSNTGLGGLISVGFNKIVPDFQLNLTTGYMEFSGRDVASSEIPGTPTSISRTSFIPLLLGARYFFPTGDVYPYGGIDAGLFWARSTTNGIRFGFSYNDYTTGTDFGFTPIAGVQIKAGERMRIDAQANYTKTFFVSPSRYYLTSRSYSWIGFGVGLVFDLQ
jgi:opacity protein-like surface antigen